MTAERPADVAALTDDEREALLRAWPWPKEAATTRGGFGDVVTAIETIITARLDAALGSNADD